MGILLRRVLRIILFPVNEAACNRLHVFQVIKPVLCPRFVGFCPLLAFADSFHKHLHDQIRWRML